VIHPNAPDFAPLLPDVPDELAEEPGEAERAAGA